MEPARVGVLAVHRRARGSARRSASRGGPLLGALADRVRRLRRLHAADPHPGDQNQPDDASGGHESRSRAGDPRRARGQRHGRRPGHRVSGVRLPTRRSRRRGRPRWREPGSRPPGEPWRRRRPVRAAPRPGSTSPRSWRSPYHHAAIRTASDPCWAPSVPHRKFAAEIGPSARLAALPKCPQTTEYEGISAPCQTNAGTDFLCSEFPDRDTSPGSVSWRSSRTRPGSRHPVRWTRCRG